MTVEMVECLLHKSKISRSVLCKMFDTEINDMRPYCTAFVHRSMQKALGISQERLEYLGDSIINLIVAELLYEKFPDCNEGDLTKMRTRIVKGDTLSSFAKALNLENYIIMSNNAQSLKRINKQSFKRVCEDTFEALVGALYVDKDLRVCKLFIMKLLNQQLDITELFQDDNYKEMLNKMVHQLHGSKPAYEVQCVQGPAHQRSFTTIVKVNGLQQGQGTGQSKKSAEMAAAKHAIEAISHSCRTVS